MAMGKKRARQQRLWIAAGELPRTKGHVFYDRVNEILEKEGFDKFAEAECLKFYKSEEIGRPSIAPGVYFRMLIVGYFEGIDSERGIAYARVGFAVLTGILGPEPGGADTGSFHAVADAPVDEPGDTLMLAPGFSEPLDGRLITCILPPRSLHAPLYRSPA